MQVYVAILWILTDIYFTNDPFQYAMPLLFLLYNIAQQIVLLFENLHKKSQIYDKILDKILSVRPKVKSP